MYAILLIFVVSINLVSSDDANVQQLLERVDVLERKLERVDVLERKLERVDMLEMKLATLSNAYEMLLEDRYGQSQCNCSDLEEDIRDIRILASKNRHNIKVNTEMINKNEDNIEANKDDIEVNAGLIQANKDDIEVNAGLIVSNKEQIESNLGIIEDNLNSINVSKSCFGM